MSADITERIFTVDCKTHSCPREADGVDGLCSTCRQTRKDAQILSQMSEQDFQREVIRLAQTLGWLAVHWRAAKTQHGWRTPIQGDGRGFPDTIFVRKNDRTVYAELKSATGKLAPEQQEWLDILRSAGEEAYVWRPQDLDEIMRVLLDKRKEAAGR